MEPSNNPNLAPTPENKPSATPEQMPAAATEAKPASPADNTPSDPVVVVPAAQTSAPVAQAPAPQKTATPATADDVDVIEKEWVEAAEKVVHEHSDDPHAEEEAFEDLQVDYLKKRYGKDIKKTDQ